MKLLLDQGLPRSTAELLREREVEATHVSEIGLSRAEDPEIIKLAQTNDQIIVTLDSDFHQFLALTKASSPSIIWIRIDKLRAPELVEIILSILNERQEMLLKGVAITVRPDRKVKTRLLPIIMVYSFQ
jgi:predicted nuclease of predicted toxin-antitoxin system